MRVYLTSGELATDEGTELLAICREITEDGRLDLDEIKRLRRWLRANQDAGIVAVGYLLDILNRATADGVIDRDEQRELHLAVERVIPTAYRQSAADARKAIETEKKERKKERKRLEQERAKEERALDREEQRKKREEERIKANRIRHAFAKVAGGTYPNADGTERQKHIKKCKAGQPLTLQPDPDNPYSDVAISVLLPNGKQIGSVPEYLAERIDEEVASGKQVGAYVTAVTGGTWSKPTRGVNFAVCFALPGVTPNELGDYVRRVIAQSESRA